MNLGLNLIKDLTPVMSGNPMMMSQLGGAAASGVSSFMSMLDGVSSAKSVTQNHQVSFDGFQPQSMQADSNSSQTRPMQVDQPPTSPQSNNQQVGQPQAQSQSNSHSSQDVKQNGNSQNASSKASDSAKNSGKTGSQDNAANTSANGTANQAADKNNVKDQTAATTADSSNALGQQVVTMADFLKGLNLSADQLAQLAASLNTTPAQLGQMQIVVGNTAQTSTAQTNTVQANIVGSIDATKLVNKVAEVLNLNKAQTDSLFAALNISSVDVKNVVAVPLTGNGAPSPALQITPANPALVAQVTAGEVKPAMQSDAGGNNFGSGAQFGSNPAVATQPVNTASTPVNFNVVLNATSSNNSQVGVTSSVAVTAQEHASSAIMGQIVEKASILSLPNATETKISLSPEKLGTVDIKLTMSDSSVSASIVVGSDAVKQVVEKNLDQLKAALNQQGIMVEQMSVSVGQQGNQSFGNEGLFGKNASGGSDSGGVAPVDLSASIKSGTSYRVGNGLVDLTA
jgi:hypothetical protein